MTTPKPLWRFLISGLIYQALAVKVLTVVLYVQTKIYIENCTPRASPMYQIKK